MTEPRFVVPAGRREPKCRVFGKSAACSGLYARPGRCGRHRCCFAAFPATAKLTQALLLQRLPVPGLILPERGSESGASTYLVLPALGAAKRCPARQKTRKKCPADIILTQLRAMLKDEVVKVALPR